MKRKIFLILLLITVIYVYKQSEEVLLIPDSSIRLRVIPNSNAPEDIYIKEKVKKYLETNIYKLTKDTKSLSDARTIINENIPNINQNIEDIFTNYKYNQVYKINYGDNYFPEKIYQGTTYKAGYYESLVISIGEAEGDNFWCVLFPNFCLVEPSENHTYKLYFKELINKIF